MITLKNLTRSYRSKAGETRVLNDIDAKIFPGEFVTIMGPSGAGKSTLLSVLGMLDHEWTGEYQLEEHSIHRLKPKDRVLLNRKYVGFVFQKFHLLDDLTVEENLDAPLSYRDIKRAERKAIVADTLDRFQIVGKKDLFPAQLSGGQQQLVGVARAVITKPALLLADEPTGNLHSNQAKEIMQLFKKLNAEGTTIVQVTHADDNASYGDRVIELIDGRIASA